MMSSITEIDKETQEEPYDQSPPVFGRQREHQYQTGEDSQDWHKRHKWRPKWPLGLRVFIAHDEHCGAYNDESQKRANIRKLGKDSQWQERRHDGDKNAGNNRGFPWRAELVVNCSEKAFGNQPIACHGKQYSRLA